MAGSMQKNQAAFPISVVDSKPFSRIKACIEVVQDFRIAYRWQVMKDENKKDKESKAKRKSYEPEVLSNGNTLRQLLAKSRSLQFKKRASGRTAKNGELESSSSNSRI